MSGYSLALFVHLAALLGAIGTAGIAHLAEARLGAADTIAAARPWAALLNRVAPVFPLALLALLASGTYLVGWVVGRRNRMLRGGKIAAASLAGLSKRQEDVAEAVHYLANQSGSGMSHELVLTAAGDLWVP